MKFETGTVLPEDRLPDLSGTQILVVGMGKLGARVYDQLAPDYGQVLTGVDNDSEVVAHHNAVGRDVVHLDATDDEIWERITDARVEVGILALKNHQENLGVIRRVRERHSDGKIFAVASHEDEIQELIDAGAEAAWNLYSEAGAGLASEVVACYNNKKAT